jgi:hypothetical protein
LHPVDNFVCNAAQKFIAFTSETKKLRGTALSGRKGKLNPH